MPQFLYYYTYSSIFDKGVAQFTHFAPRQGYFLQEEFTSLYHHILTLWEILWKRKKQQPSP